MITSIYSSHSFFKQENVFFLKIKWTKNKTKINRTKTKNTLHKYSNNGHLHADFYSKSWNMNGWTYEKPWSVGFSKQRTKLFPRNFTTYYSGPWWCSCDRLLVFFFSMLNRSIVWKNKRAHILWNFSTAKLLNSDQIVFKHLLAEFFFVIEMTCFPNQKSTKSVVIFLFTFFQLTRRKKKTMSSYIQILPLT